MADAFEQRTVEVNDPKLSASANHRLTEALREVIGSDQVSVPADRPHFGEGERPRASPLARITSTKMMVIGMVAIGVCVGLVILATTGDHWWLTGVAFVVLAFALAAVTSSIIGLASTEEFPDPGLAALLSEEGIRDPEVRFSEFVREFTPVADGENRDTEAGDDPAQAAAEQREAMTPSGGPSTAVGPES
jgi:hypothetical protein